MTLNALPGVSLPAKITQIAPTATISSGVVNYAVTVNITSLPPVTAGSTSAATANATGQLSAALQQAVQSGRMTQAQADALAQQGLAAGGFTPRAGAASGAGTPSSGSSGSRATSQLPSTATQNFQLKQGLTGTVDLIVSQRSNVLLVPNNAITKAGTQSTVQVVTGNNTIEKRAVQIGLADWQNTEITSGLSEGEKIIVPKTTATTATTSTSQQGAPGGGIFFGR
jgi:hypothetical protein